MPGLLTAAVILLTGGPPSQEGDTAGVERVPKKVADFIERRAYCNHFLGEEPYDRERAADLNRTIAELRCNRLDRDERTLRRTYRNKAAILQLLDETADALP